MSETTSDPPVVRATQPWEEEYVPSPEASRWVKRGRRFSLASMAALALFFVAMIAGVQHDDHVRRVTGHSANDTWYFVVMGVSFLATWVFFGIMFYFTGKAEKERRNYKDQQQALREQDPEWPEYQRLNTKFYE